MVYPLYAIVGTCGKESLHDAHTKVNGRLQQGERICFPFSGAVGKGESFLAVFQWLYCIDLSGTEQASNASLTLCWETLASESKCRGVCEECVGEEKEAFVPLYCSWREFKQSPPL